MAQSSAEIRDNQKSTLTSLLMTEMLGGDLQDAITQARAPMHPDDITAVVNEIEERRKQRNKNK
jgi:hypothetical protein